VGFIISASSFSRICCTIPAAAGQFLLLLETVTTALRQLRQSSFAVGL
jgi:hypothetical protein